MPKPTVRQTEARLAGDVEDKILQRLGYREYEITLPNGEIVTPRPKTSELSSQQASRAFSEQILNELSGSHRPATIWKVEIPRTYPPSKIRTEGVWVVTPDEEMSVSCYPLTIERYDARWTVYLTPQRRGSLIP